MSMYETWPVPNVSAVHLNPTGIDVFGDPNRVYELASVTKLLATYGFLIAVEEGVFELDDELTFAEDHGVSPRQLLSHASGVGFARGDAARAPLTRRIYSSYGFELLAQHLAAEAQMPFDQYLQQAVFDPLGMRTATLWGSPGHEARASIADLQAFAQELLNPTLVDPRTLTEATTVQFPELPGIVPGYGMFKPCPWGLGFEIKGEKTGHWLGDNAPVDTVGHFGQSGTFLWVHRPQQRAAVVLTDQPFGSWAKPLWQEHNQALWQHT